MKRTKFDDQLEELLESFLRNWKLSVPVLSIIAGYFIYNRWEHIAPAVPLDIAAELAVAFGSLLLSLLAVVLVFMAIRQVWVYFYNKKNFIYLQILPHADDEVNPDTLGEMVRRIHGAKRGPVRRLMWGKEQMVFMVHYRNHAVRGKQYMFYVGAPRDRMSSVKHHMRSLYAKSEFYPADDIQFPKSGAAGGRLRMNRKRHQATLSLARYKNDQLPGVLAMMEPGTWLQLSFSADSEYRLKKRIIEAEKLVKKGKGYRARTAFDREEEKSFKTRFYGNEVSFNVTVSVASESYRAWSVVRDTVDALAAMMSDVNELRYRRLPGSVHRFPIPYPYRMVWTGSEMAKLFHLPELKGAGIAEEVAGRIPHSNKGTQRLQKETLSTGFNFGSLVHPLLENRAVRIDPKALGKHWGLTGVVGSGKSTILNTILVSFIEYSLSKEKSPGFSFIDPKKETATIVLNQLLKKEKDGHRVDWSKVKWISFKEAEHPPAMNLLYRMPGVPDKVLTDQIMRIIKETGFNPAPQAERLLKKCIQTLLADESETHTILGVKPLLLHPSFRRSVLARLKTKPEHADLVEFWEYEAEDLMRVSGTAILNRLDMFYDDFLRRIFGQTDFNFPIREWMDNGYMVFYDFSGMSEEETGLIGGYLSYLYYRIADTRPDRSMLHQFVIDEAQRVKASILPEIHAEMRSKGLSLGISTQTIEKLPPGLQKSLVNIVGNMFVCRQGQDGAKIAASAFKTSGPSGTDVLVYSEGYLKNLPELTVILKTEDKGRTVYAVVKVPPLDRYLPDGSLAPFDKPAEIEKSNAWTYAKAKELEQKNGGSIAEIDAAIQKYLNEEQAEPVSLVKREEIKLEERLPVRKEKEEKEEAFSLLGGLGDGKQG